MLEESSAKESEKLIDRQDLIDDEQKESSRRFFDEIFRQAMGCLPEKKEEKNPASNSSKPESNAAAPIWKNSLPNLQIQNEGAATKTDNASSVNQKAKPDLSATKPDVPAAKPDVSAAKTDVSGTALPPALSAETLAKTQEDTARKWNTRGYGSEAITAGLVKQGIRAPGKENDDQLVKLADSSQNRRRFKEFGNNSSDLIEGFKSDSRFALVQQGRLQEGELRRGDILVWPKDKRHPYGLSKVYLGEGKTASDHIASLKDDMRSMGSSTQPYVFRLKDGAEKESSVETKLEPKPQTKPDSPEESPREKIDSPSTKPDSANTESVSSRMSDDPTSPDYFKFKEKDGSITDLRQIASTGFPRNWDSYDNAPRSGFAAVKDKIAQVATGKGLWNNQMEKRFQELKNDPRMHYSMMVDGKVVAESKDAQQAQEGASTTKAIIFAARHILAEQQGKKLSELQYKEEMATLAYSLNQLVRPVQRECTNDSKSDPAGTKSIMGVMSQLGISENSQPTWGPNRLAPRDGASFMHKVMTNSFTGAEKLKTMMEMCKYGDEKMVMTAPKGVPVAHKTGTYNGNNDLGGCVVRGNDGKDHIVTFSAQTKLPSRDIGILFGGLLREQGLNQAPAKAEPISPSADQIESKTNKNKSELRDSHGEPLGNGQQVQARQLFDYFREKGFSDAQASGILGNILAESNFRTDAYNPSEEAIGLCQWEGSRRTDLERFAAKTGRAMTDWRMQADFIMHEFSTTEKRAYSALMETKTAEQAALAFQSRYERSASLGNRAVDAKRFYNELHEEKPSPLPKPSKKEENNEQPRKQETIEKNATPDRIENKEKSALNRKLQKYYEQLGSMEEIDKRHPFDMNALASRKSLTQYDRDFIKGKEKFKEMQENGKAPTMQQLFEQAKAIAPAGQRYFEASVPYWVSESGRESVGQNFMWDESGKLIGEAYWRRGGGDQLGHGKTVAIYHNIEGMNAGGTDIGWINQSKNESVIARGGNPPVDMHGRSMSSGTSAGCEAHPSDKDYQNWPNFKEKMHLAILDNQARGLRPFASLHVGYKAY